MTDAPYATRANRTRVIWMIENNPPPKPACFDTMRQWQEYLLYVDASGEPVVQRRDHGRMPVRVVSVEFRRIDYCADCDIGSARQQRMQVEGRCIIPHTKSPPDNP